MSNELPEDDLDILDNAIVTVEDALDLLKQGSNALEPLRVKMTELIKEMGEFDVE